MRDEEKHTAAIFVRTQYSGGRVRARVRSNDRTNDKEWLWQSERECEEGRRLAGQRRKFGREVDCEEERQNEVNERARDGRRVQSGGTRGARKAVVCRGPPHWHTVVRYDPHRTPICTGPHSHQRSRNTTSASAVRTGKVTLNFVRDWSASQNRPWPDRANCIFQKR